MKIRGCEYPPDLLYDVEGGTWVRKEAGACVLGIAPSLGWLSGGFTKVGFKDAGTAVGAGRVLGQVEGPRHFDVVRAPFDCVVRAVNDELLAEPRLLNRDPYGKGWFVRLERVGAEDRLSLMPAAAGAIEARLRELGVQCFAQFPDVEMYEIGVECSAVLVRLGEEMERSAPGTTVHVVSDDPSAEIEMERWRDQTGNLLLETRAEGQLRHFIVKKP